MASKIPSSPPPPSTSNAQRPSAAVANPVLQLQGALPAQFKTGDSAQAQVLALREAQQAFQVMLRLSLNNGQQRTIEVQTSQPLATGSTLSVTAISTHQLSFNLIPTQQAAAATRIDTSALPP